MPKTLTQERPDLERAKACLERIRELDREQRLRNAEIADLLLAMSESGDYRALGFTSVSAMAKECLGYAGDKTSSFLQLARSKSYVPEIHAAFADGSLGWTKAREIIKVASPHDQAEWIGKAQAMSSRRLERECRGGDESVRRTLTLSPQEAARFDQLIAGVKDQLDVSRSGEAVLALLEGAGAELGAKTRTRVVIQECPSCRAATLEGEDGPVPVARAEVDVARCSGEIHDLRRPESVVTRAIPAAVYRRVMDRDKRRCGVPNCRHMSFLEVHHLDGWRSGHNAKRMLVLCGEHHRQHHEGWLEVRGEASSFRFFRSDGVELLGEESSQPGGEPKTGEDFARAKRSSNLERARSASAELQRDSLARAKVAPLPREDEPARAGASSSTGSAATRLESERNAAAKPQSRALARAKAAPLPREVEPARVEASSSEDSTATEPSSLNPRGRESGDPFARAKPVEASRGEASRGLTRALARATDYEQAKALLPPAALREAERRLAYLGVAARQRRRLIGDVVSREKRLRWTAQRLVLRALRARNEEIRRRPAC